MVMYGPIPTMSVMASAVACTRPNSRRRPGLSVEGFKHHLWGAAFREIWRSNSAFTRGWGRVGLGASPRR